METNKFEIILDQIVLDNKEMYRDFSITNIKIRKELRQVDVYLSKQFVIAFSLANSLEKQVETYFNNILPNYRVICYFNYQEKSTTIDTIKAYYDDVLELLSQRSSRILALKSLNNNITENEVYLYVANFEEQKIFEPLVNIVSLEFKRYGLGFVNLKCSVSSFETSISDLINKSNQLSNEKIKTQIQLQEKQENPVSSQTIDQMANRKGVKKPRKQSPINGDSTSLKEIPNTEYEIIEYKQIHEDANFIVVGTIVKCEIREIKTFKLYVATLFDGDDSIVIKCFISSYTPGSEEFYRKDMAVGMKVRVYGEVTYDKFERDVCLQIKDAISYGKNVVIPVTDDAPFKRVELHAHSKMSAQDGVMEVEEYVSQCADYGHKALALTDHYNVQALPDLEHAIKDVNKKRDLDIKPIFGFEGNVVDESDFRIALTDDSFNLSDATYVVYDFETTGFSAIYHEIIEIGAVKVSQGMVIDRFSSFIKPNRPIPLEITNLTSITNDDVRHAKNSLEVLTEFKKFIDGCCLVAHNATFDNSHLYENLKRLNLFDGYYPTIDTLQLARCRYSHKLKRFRLDNLAKFFQIDLSHHHRAVDDAEATSGIFLKMLSDLLKDGYRDYKDINSCINVDEAYKLSYPHHVTILCKNVEGKKNMNKLVSDSHTVHFHNNPRILKSFLTSHRDGLLIGSGCYNGVVFDTAYRMGDDKLKEVIKYFDFIEVQPPEVYSHMIVENGDPDTLTHIKKTIKRIIKFANEAGILVCATGDVHHLTREDKQFREIFIDAPQVGGGHHDLYGKKIGSQHYRSTLEMLNDFNFLPDDVAFEIVVTNTNLIADMIEKFPLFPKELFAPKDDFMDKKGIPSIKVALKELCYNSVHTRYGEKPHQLIIDRLEKELHSIITNEFSSNYYISHLLVKKTREAGYVVGSRGSVGSSLVANFMNITEVNSLPPHYVCPKCHFTAIKMTDEELKKYGKTDLQSKFDDDLNSVTVGCDLPERVCPCCGEKLNRDGFDIPFETFLGFNGDKTPDIDLNYSGDYQATAHEYCRELFGSEKAFRAGTIGTIAEKTAYGYVKGWLERQNKAARSAEIERLSQKIVGVKRSTGQHPGGIVVIPRDMDYSDIIPIQYPADDTSAAWRTSHYDYHKFESNLLKLDILGHDDPTMIRHLMNFVDEFPEEFPFSVVEDIPIADTNVINLFSSITPLGITPEQVHGDTIGTTGLPEFGTSIAKNMLNEIRPKTVSDLVKISGLSHGTDVWVGNARDFMLGLKPGVSPIPFKELIGCRDDIMVYLIEKGLPANTAFKIMEAVRKGKGVSSDFEKEMRKYNVPEWYLESCKLIKYMFPKAHAAAYVIMALRIGWFKVYRPIYYYAGYFSRRIDAYNVEVMLGGWDKINARIAKLDQAIQNKTITTKESDEYSMLLLALEMTARGYTFKPISLEKSDFRDFLVSDDKMSLIIPFKAIDSLGENTAKTIVEARKVAPFSSKKDVMRRTKINNTVFEKMTQLGIFDDLPDDDELRLFF